jgi:[FeFe] hydrogenase (group B1/B3)
MSIYHEREILAQRIKQYLGLDYTKSKDLELFEIVDKLENILSNKSEYISKGKFLDIIKEACDGCPTKKYYITDGCRTCVAQSCINVCPKNAITKTSNNRMKIDEEKCINCGLCANSCNYNAIIVQERPCEIACSLNAIGKSKQSNENTNSLDSNDFKSDNSPKINKDLCVNCGNCFKECPFGAIESPSQMLQLQYSLNNNEKIVAIFAPSITGQFGMKVNSLQIKEALYKIGFDNVIEAAVGADEVAKEEAKIIENSDELVTTSCCPAFVECIEKHYNDYKKNVSHEYSPMSFLANKIKQENKNIKIAFIGPCIAKKQEAFNNELVDYVITFEELGAMFIAKHVEPSKLEGENIQGSDFGWNFAKSGGVAEAVVNNMSKELKILKMNGLEEARKTFGLLKKEKYDLLEGMACNGGCVGGPGIMIDSKIAMAKLKTKTK